MENTYTPTRIEKAIKLDYSNDNDRIWLTQQNTLRRLIGILGMMLPFLLWLFLYIDNGHTAVLPSISHYYFTRVSGIFVIIVSLLAIFLLVYKGKGRMDFILSSTAGLFALCVVLFPTDNLAAKSDHTLFPYVVSFLKTSPFRVGFHYISAAIFLGCLAAMSWFLFTLSDKEPSKRGKKKIWRNRIYRMCAIAMVLALLLVFAGYKGWFFQNWYSLTFWMEAIAIEAFGISWLVKGEAILKD